MNENNELFELMTKIYGELQETKKEMNTRFNSLESRFDKLETKVDNLETKVDNLETKVDNLETKVDNLETKVDKNSLLLEKLDSNIKLVAEVQTSFQEQLGRNILEDGKTVSDRLEIIELAVTNSSENINDLAGNLDVVKSTVGSHEMDLRMMKHKRNHTF